MASSRALDKMTSFMDLPRVRQFQAVQSSVRYTGFNTVRKFMPIERTHSYTQCEMYKTFYDSVFLKGGVHAKCELREEIALVRTVLLLLSLEPFCNQLGVGRVWGVLIKRGMQPYITALNKDACTNKMLVLDLDDLTMNSWHFEDMISEEIHPRITMLMSLAFFVSVCVLLKNI